MIRSRSLRLGLLVAVLAALPMTSADAHLDHPVPTIGGTAPPLSTQFNSGGENVEWELLATIPTLNPHSDLDFFQQKGETFASVGNLGSAANGGGQVIVQLTEDGEVDGSTPQIVSNHPSASCVSDPSAALGLQHDVEATPKASTIQNTQVPGQNTTETQLLLDATDAAGRCHDQGVAGLAAAPNGGLEIIDVTDVTNPKEIGLTSHIGEAHTVNVDPRRPHIAYVVSSDSVSVDEEGKRANEEGSGLALDGFEVVDLRSCLEAPLGTVPPDATIEQKRELCRPQVFRYRYPSPEIVLGHTNQGTIYGCHELEVYPDDRLTCASGSAAILFDIKGAFDDSGTPADFTDDKLRGTPLPCAVRESSTTTPGFGTGAKVTDCVTGQDGETAVDLGIPGWIEAGSPSLAGVEHVGSAFHMGRESATGAFSPAYPATEDVDFDHELEFSDSRRLLIATDERGGGVTGGAQCSEGADLDFANGGLHAYRVGDLLKRTPQGEDEQARAEAAFRSYARDSEGDKAIFRAPVRTPLQPTFCTAHVFQQIPGENRIFMGWYSQGTQVVDFTENPDGTVDFKLAGYFVPELANQWVSAIFKVQRNADGTTTYYGATGDGVVGDSGRNGIDVYKVTLPSAPEPAQRVGADAPPTTPGLPDGPTPDPSCAITSGFDSADVRPKGRGLAFAFERSVRAKARVDVFQSAIGDRLVRKRVARFDDRAGNFTWRARGKKLRNGTYVARLKVKVPGRGADTRRFSLRRAKGRFTTAPAYDTPKRCGLVRRAALSRNAFGGREDTPLRIGFRLNDAAKVSVTVSRGGKVVKRYAARTYQPGPQARLTYRTARRGLHKVVIRAERGKRQATVTLASRAV